jgi:hypothetical protein
LISNKVILLKIGQGQKFKSFLNNEIGLNRILPSIPNSTFWFSQMIASSVFNSFLGQNVATIPMLFKQPIDFNKLPSALPFIKAYLFSFFVAPI